MRALVALRRALVVLLVALAFTSAAGAVQVLDFSNSMGNGSRRNIEPGCIDGGGEQIRVILQSVENKSQPTNTAPKYFFYDCIGDTGTRFTVDVYLIYGAYALDELKNNPWVKGFTTAATGAPYGMGAANGCPATSRCAIPLDPASVPTMFVVRMPQPGETFSDSATTNAHLFGVVESVRINNAGTWWYDNFMRYSKPSNAFSSIPPKFFRTPLMNGMKTASVTAAVGSVPGLPGCTTPDNCEGQYGDGAATGSPPGGTDWGSAPVNDDTKCSILDVFCALKKAFVPSPDFMSDGYSRFALEKMRVPIQPVDKMCAPSTSNMFKELCIDFSLAGGDNPAVNAILRLIGWYQIFFFAVTYLGLPNPFTSRGGGSSALGDVTKRINKDDN